MVNYRVPPGTLIRIWLPERAGEDLRDHTALLKVGQVSGRRLKGMRDCIAYFFGPFAPGEETPGEDLRAMDSPVVATSWDDLEYVRHEIVYLGGSWSVSEWPVPVRFLRPGSGLKDVVEKPIRFNMGEIFDQIDMDKLICRKGAPGEVAMGRPCMGTASIAAHAEVLMGVHRGHYSGYRLGPWDRIIMAGLMDGLVAGEFDELVLDPATTVADVERELGLPPIGGGLGEESADSAVRARDLKEKVVGREKVTVAEMVDQVEVDGSEEESEGLMIQSFDWSVEDTVEEAGYEANGVFWECVARFVEPDASSRVEFDCEGNAFAAYGEPEDLERLRAAVVPLMNDDEAVRSVIERAEAAGHDFSDV